VHIFRVDIQIKTIEACLKVRVTQRLGVVAKEEVGKKEECNTEKQEK
jgi:hypothetical protein